MRNWIEAFFLALLLAAIIGIATSCAPVQRNQQQICEDFAEGRDHLFSVGVLGEQGYRVSCELRPEPPKSRKENA